MTGEQAAMTDAELADFKCWAEAHASDGYVQAKRSLQLIAMYDAATAEVDRLRQQIAGHAERIASQAELLTKRAESATPPTV